MKYAIWLNQLFRYDQGKWQIENVCKKSYGLVAQTVKNLPAMTGSWVRSLAWEDPLEEGIAMHSSILAWRIPMDRRAWGYSPWGRKDSDITEWLSIGVDNATWVSVCFT